MSSLTKATPLPKATPLTKATPLPKAPQKRIIRKPKTNVPAAAAVVPTAVPLVVPELLTTGALSEEEEEEEAEVPQSEDEENEEGEGDSDVGEEDAENSDIEKDVEEEEEEDEDKPAAPESEEEEEEEEGEEGPVGEEDEELISTTTAAAKKKKNTKRSGAAATKGNRKMNKKNIDIGMLETDEELALGIQQQQNYPLDSSGEEEEEEDDDDDENGENYLQKFDNDLRTDFISNFHPEAKTHNYEEVKALTRLVRDGNGLINDPLHKTLPFMTKYEMTRVLGQRAKQIDSGAKPFVKVPLNIMDGYHIASLELEQKKLPFIIKRPLPNGGIEYWDISDLEIL